jgi:hypothetical protein
MAITFTMQPSTTRPRNAALPRNLPKRYSAFVTGIAAIT